MTKKSTQHTTGVGKLLFAAIARPLDVKVKGVKTGKQEYSVKIELMDTDPAVSHLEEVAINKVDTKTNRALAGTGKTVINFSSTFAPLVVDANNNKLEGKEIPFFDGRIDTGTAAVSYSVVHFEDRADPAVYLTGIKLLTLESAPREETKGGTTEDLFAKLKAIQ